MEDILESTYREEKSLRHVAMLANFVDNNKPRMSLRKWIRTVSRSSTILFNFIKFIKNVGEILWGWIRKLRKRKRKFLCCVRHLLHKAGAWNKEVPCRSRTTTAKKWTRRAWFVVLVLLFRCFSLPSPSSLLKFADVVIEKSCYYGNVTQHFSSLLRGELEWKKVFHFLERK